MWLTPASFHTLSTGQLVSEIGLQMIIYVLPWYKAAEKASVYQTNAKIQAKWEKLKKEKETTWALFVAEELLKSRANLQLAGETIENGGAVNPGDGPKTLDKEGSPSLYEATMAAQVAVVYVYKLLIVFRHS